MNEISEKKKNINPHRDHRSRMRERFYISGLEGFSDHEVLEMLLYNTVPRRDTNVIAHNLIEHFGSYYAVLDADPEDLRRVPMVGEQTAAFLAMLPECFRRYQMDRHGVRPRLNSTERAGEYAADLFVGKQVEEFYIICLDVMCCAMRSVRISTGELDYAQVDVRRVVDAALHNNSISVILCHNHPSGCLQPSAADVKLTDHICAALIKVNIEVRDHLIVSGSRFVSMRELGLIDEHSYRRVYHDKG